jgi:hypothetical protein
MFDETLPFAARAAEPFAIRPAVRIGLAALGLVLVGLLGTAAMLTPHEQGFGTHQQLGLPPCSFKTVAGLRCPACGMTTAWANLMRGRIVQAGEANLGGLLLGLAALAIGPWAVVSAMRGRWLWGRPDETWTAAVAAMIVAVTLIEWGVRVVLLR